MSEFLGLKVKVDPSCPPNTVRFVNAKDQCVGLILNVALGAGPYSPLSNVVLPSRAPRAPLAAAPESEGDGNG